MPNFIVWETSHEIVVYKHYVEAADAEQARLKVKDGDLEGSYVSTDINGREFNVEAL